MKKPALKKIALTCGGTTTLALVALILALSGSDGTLCETGAGYWGVTQASRIARAVGFRDTAYQWQGACCKTLRFLSEPGSACEDFRRLEAARFPFIYIKPPIKQALPFPNSPVAVIPRAAKPEKDERFLAATPEERCAKWKDRESCGEIRRKEQDAARVELKPPKEFFALETAEVCQPYDRGNGLEFDCHQDMSWSGYLRGTRIRVEEQLEGMSRAGANWVKTADLMPAEGVTKAAVVKKISSILETPDTASARTPCELERGSWVFLFGKKGDLCDIETPSKKRAWAECSFLSESETDVRAAETLDKARAMSNAGEFGSALSLIEKAKKNGRNPFLPLLTELVPHLIELKKAQEAAEADPEYQSCFLGNHFLDGD